MELLWNFNILIKYFYLYISFKIKFKISINQETILMASNQDNNEEKYKPSEQNNIV